MVCPFQPSHLTTVAGPVDFPTSLGLLHDHLGRVVAELRDCVSYQREEVLQLKEELAREHAFTREHETVAEGLQKALGNEQCVCSKYS